MKRKKNISISVQAVAIGEQLALERGTDFSNLIEEHLLQSPRVKTDGSADYWPGPALKPVRRSGDRRHDYLQAKHQ